MTDPGDAGVAPVKELTEGLRAHSTVETVGTHESMMQATRATHPGSYVGYVGVVQGVHLPGEELFYAEVHLHGGPGHRPHFLTELIDLIWNHQVDPSKVLDLELRLAQVAEGDRAMDARRASKALLRR